MGVLEVHTTCERACVRSSVTFPPRRRPQRGRRTTSPAPPPSSRPAASCTRRQSCYTSRSGCMRTKGKEKERCACESGVRQSMTPGLRRAFVRRREETGGEEEGWMRRISMRVPTHLLSVVQALKVILHVIDALLRVVRFRHALRGHERVSRSALQENRAHRHAHGAQAVQMNELTLK